MADTRKNYTKEFKLEAVRMLEAGTKTGHEIEQDLQIGSGQVYRWKKQFVEDGVRAFPGNGKPRDARVGRVAQREQESARGTRHSAKSSGHILKTPKMKHQFMANNLGTYGVEKMARVLSISRSGYYAWMERPESARERQKVELTEQIRQIQGQVHHRYGAPRVTKELARRGRSGGHNRVARILREKGLGARPKRRFRKRPINCNY
jgi:transposase-like protein